MKLKLVELPIKEFYGLMCFLWAVANTRLTLLKVQIKGKETSKIRIVIKIWLWSVAAERVIKIHECADAGGCWANKVRREVEEFETNKKC